MVVSGPGSWISRLRRERSGRSKGKSFAATFRALSRSSSPTVHTVHAVATVSMPDGEGNPRAPPRRSGPAVRYDKGRMRTIHDLADDERAVLTELRRRIAREFPELDVRMTVFGSRARGDADPESDMDILLEVAVAQLAFADKRRLRQAATDVSIAAGIIVSLLVVD